MVSSQYVGVIQLNVSNATYDASVRVNTLVSRAKNPQACSRGDCQEGSSFGLQ